MLYYIMTLHLKYSLLYTIYLVNIAGTGIPAGFARVLSRVRVRVRVREFVPVPVPVPVELIINCGNTMLPHLIWPMF